MFPRYLQGPRPPPHHKTLGEEGIHRRQARWSPPSNKKKLPDKLYFCTGVKVSRDFQSQEQTLQLRFSPSSYFTQNKSKDLHSFGKNYRPCCGLQTSTVGTSIFSSTFSLPPWSSPSCTCCCSEAFIVGQCHFCSIIHSPKSPARPEDVETHQKYWDSSIPGRG